MPSEATKFSEITINDLVNYLRYTDYDSTDTIEVTLLKTILEASKNHVLTYTGRTESEADTMPELTIAVYVICQNMYDKRSVEVDSSIINKVLESILGSRSINLL